MYVIILMNLVKELESILTESIFLTSFSGAGILLRVKRHVCVFIAGTQRASALFASRIDIFYANNVNLIVIFILCNH